MLMGKAEPFEVFDLAGSELHVVKIALYQSAILPSRDRTSCLSAPS